MKPIQRHSNRSLLKIATALCASLLIALAGCTGSLLNSRSQSPDPDHETAADADTKLVSDFAAPYGTTYIRVEAPVLITSLAGTGSDPPPGPQRASLLADMQAHNVVNPNHILASPNNSIAWARAYLPPGVRKGQGADRRADALFLLGGRGPREGVRRVL